MPRAKRGFKARRRRNRILKEAAAQIRQSGLESISLATLMKKANLTHGGFYGHFDSRSNLLAAALERALIEGEAAARAHAAPDRPRSFATMVRSYLSRTHRDNRHAGCAIASLAVDVARADEETRGVMAPHIEKAIAKIRDALGDRTEDRAIVAMSAMVGAMALSRVMTDPKRSDALLRATRDYLLDMQQDPPT